MWQRFFALFLPRHRACWYCCAAVRMPDAATDKFQSSTHQVQTTTTRGPTRQPWQQQVVGHATMQCCNELLKAYGGIGVAIFAEIPQKYIVELPLSLHHLETTTTTLNSGVHVHASADGGNGSKHIGNS